MSFYMGAVILTELMMIAMVLHVLHYSGFTKIQKTWFLLTFISIMFCTAAEFAVHCGYYSSAFKIPLTILTVLQFSIAPVLATLFSGALGLKHQGKNAIVFISTSFFVEVLCAPFGWIFYFDDAGYHRGNQFFIYEVFYIISLAYLIVSMLIVGRKFSHRDARTIIMIIVILTAGILPMTFYKLNITYIAIAIGSVFCYVYYNDLVQQDIQSELVLNQEKVSTMQNHIITSLSV